MEIKPCSLGLRSDGHTRALYWNESSLEAGITLQGASMLGSIGQLLWWARRNRLMAAALAFLLCVGPAPSRAQTQASIDLAQQMYVAYYGRPGDPSGRNYWSREFDRSPSLDQVLSEFGNSQEYADNFGSLTNSQLVSGLYEQMFNRLPESTGLAFYVDRLDRGVSTLANIAKQIADGAGGGDLVTLNNKIVVANAFTDHVQTRGVSYQASDIVSVSALLASVTSSSESVQAALAEVARFGTTPAASPVSIAPILQLLLNI